MNDPADIGGTTLEELEVPCPSCRASGKHAGDELVRANGCPFCGGRQRVTKAFADEYRESDPGRVRCEPCRGTGWTPPDAPIATTFCTACGGTGLA